MAMGSYLSIITLNVNGLNAPTKRQRLAEWIQKQDPYICCLQETHFRTRDTYSLKLKGWKKLVHVNGDQKKAGVVISISDKIEFFFLFIYFYQLEANYFATLQWVWSYIDMNQPWIYMYSQSRSPLPRPSPPNSSNLLETVFKDWIFKL